MNRREFLRVLVLGVLASGIKPERKVSEVEESSFEQGVQRFRSLSKDLEIDWESELSLADAVPEDIDSLHQLGYFLLSLMREETALENYWKTNFGGSSELRDWYNDIRLTIQDDEDVVELSDPVVIEYGDWGGALGDAGGVTSCRDGRININPELLDEGQKVGWIMGHEGVHYLYNLCAEGMGVVPVAVTQSMETATQLRMINIAARKVDQGDYRFLPVFVYGLREMTMYAFIRSAMENKYHENEIDILRVYFETMTEMGAVNDVFYYQESDRIVNVLNNQQNRVVSESYGYDPLGVLLNQFNTGEIGRIVSVDEYGRGKYVEIDLSPACDLIRCYSEIVDGRYYAQAKVFRVDQDR